MQNLVIQGSEGYSLAENFRNILPQSGSSSCLSTNISEAKGNWIFLRKSRLGLRVLIPCLFYILWTIKMKNQFHFEERMGFVCQFLYTRGEKFVMLNVFEYVAAQG